MQLDSETVKRACWLGEGKRSINGRLGNRRKRKFLTKLDFFYYGFLHYSYDEIAAGPTVWDGILDNKLPGECTQHFKIYSTSRRVASGPFQQSLFKCQLISLGEAIGRNFYGVWKPDAAW